MDNVVHGGNIFGEGGEFGGGGEVEGVGCLVAGTVEGGEVVVGGGLFGDFETEVAEAGD